MMIEIKIGAIVENRGNEVGRIERVVLDREWYEVTHLVIKHGGPLNPRHILIPVDWVIASMPERVRIDRTEEEISALPNFEVQHYVNLEQLDQEHIEHPRSKVKPSDWINYFVPLFANAFGDPYHTPGVVVTDQMLTSSESVIRRGISVESCDGHKLGEVQEVLLSAPDWRLSAIIIARGFVLKHPMRMPADWIAKIERERILLNRSKKQVEEWEKQQG
jgi:sporulation protein YlmC with PRC-barrel domain